MKRILIAVAAALLTTGAAHASPTLPREFQGAWCGVDAEAKVWARQTNCMPSSGLDITPTHEATCTVAYVKPAKNGRYHLTFACVDAPNDNDTIAIEHYWMRLHNGSLYMQRVNSAFSKPAQESKS